MTPGATTGVRGRERQGYPDGDDLSYAPIIEAIVRRVRQEFCGVGTGSDVCLVCQGAGRFLLRAFGRSACPAWSGDGPVSAAPAPGRWKAGAHA